MSPQDPLSSLLAEGAGAREPIGRESGPSAGAPHQAGAGRTVQPAPGTCRGSPASRRRGFCAQGMSCQGESHLGAGGNQFFPHQRRHAAWQRASTRSSSHHQRPPLGSARTTFVPVLVHTDLWAARRRSSGLPGAKPLPESGPGLTDRRSRARPRRLSLAACLPPTPDAPL